MKYLKLFMLFVAAPFIASCSSDDDDYNTAETIISFQSETLKTKESAGFFNVPITVEGVRNGDVNVTITTTPAEVNGAIEGEHYRITDKTLALTMADTASTATINVQVEALDNPDINEDRSFTMTIVANGGTVKTQQITVVLRDNDAAFYEKFHGKWTLTAIGDGDVPVRKTITISGAIDEEDPAYNKELTVSAPKLFNVGVDLDCSWKMSYTFDQNTKKGSIGIICGEEIASYGGVYSWIWATDNGVSLTIDPVVAEWALEENDAFPTTIEFPKGQTLYLYQNGAGYWDYIYDVVLTKQ